MRKPGGHTSSFNPLVLCACLALAGPAAAQTRSGRTSASATSMVTLRIPSVLGVDVPSLPAASVHPSSAVFVSRGGPASVETLPLQLISTNAAGTLYIVRTLRRPTEVVEVRSSSREGALGWTLLKDRIGLPAALTASSGAERKTTVVYEVWGF
jgi:hypothetical protein